MKPLDPRLLRYASAARGFIGLTVAIGLVQILLVLAFMWLLAATLTGAIGAVTGPPISEFPVPGDLSVATMLTVLSVVVILRALLSWAAEVTSARAAVKVKSQLRSRTTAALVHSVGRGGTEALDEKLNSAHAVSLLGSGLDALDGYFARYLPQLVLTTLAVPIYLVVLAVYDSTTAVIVALTMPLIPIFMVLIGWTTQAAQRKQRERLSRLARVYLDIIEGLGTLKVFNRTGHQRRNIRYLSDQYRRSTMRVLRVSFLSGFVLELVASLSVALVAVSIGVRLIDGSLGLFVGLFALLIVPEAYAPLRQVGANYHAAADGVAAAEEVFEILDDAPSSSIASGESEAKEGVELAGSGSGKSKPGGPGQGVSGPGCSELGTRRPNAPGQRNADQGVPGRSDVGSDSRSQPGGPSPLPPRRLEIADLVVSRGGAEILGGLSCAALTGHITAIRGTSGAGKSTLFAALLGLVPSTGSIRLVATAEPHHGHRSAQQSTKQNGPDENADAHNLSAPASGFGGSRFQGQATQDTAGVHEAELVRVLGREDIAWSGQRHGLSSGTVLDNVTLGDPTPNTDLARRQLDALGLNQLELDAPVGVRGSGLSGGQAHRVSVARALYRAERQRCPVLLLDEPSAALDDDAEQLVATALHHHAAAGRVVMLISHRKALLAVADEVFDFDQLSRRHEEATHASG